MNGMTHKRLCKIHTGILWLINEALKVLLACWLRSTNIYFKSCCILLKFDVVSLERASRSLYNIEIWYPEQFFSEANLMMSGPVMHLGSMFCEEKEICFYKEYILL